VSTFTANALGEAWARCAFYSCLPLASLSRLSLSPLSPSPEPKPQRHQLVPAGREAHGIQRVQPVLPLAAKGQEMRRGDEQGLLSGCEPLPLRSPLSCHPVRQTLSCQQLDEWNRARERGVTLWVMVLVMQCRAAGALSGPLRASATRGKLKRLSNPILNMKKT
jgi:hypothetical protein